jgi:hypothetical protein
VARIAFFTAVRWLMRDFFCTDIGNLLFNFYFLTAPADFVSAYAFAYSKARAKLDATALRQDDSTFSDSCSGSEDGGRPKVKGGGTERIKN